MAPKGVIKIHKKRTTNCEKEKARKENKNHAKSKSN